MALLTGYYGQDGYTGPNNKVLDELPKDVNVIISSKEVDGGGLEILYSATHTERFRFVGMSEAAATTCQADMIELYTEVINGVAQCVADVSATRQDGRMWQVSVSVMRVEIVTHYQAPE